MDTDSSTWDGRHGLARKDGAAADHSASDVRCMQPEEEDRVSEAIVLVGDIPCRMARPIGEPAM
jgi:hypothetical protein